MNISIYIYIYRWGHELLARRRGPSCANRSKCCLCKISTAPLRALMSHVTHVDESCHTYWSVMSHILMSWSSQLKCCRSICTNTLVQRLRQHYGDLRRLRQHYGALGYGNTTAHYGNTTVALRRPAQSQSLPHN